MENAFIKKANFLAIFSIFFLLLGSINAQINKHPQKEINRNELSEFGKIEKALSTKEITLDDWAIYTVHALFAPEKLPEKYKSLKSSRELTWIFDKIFNNWSKFSMLTKLELQQYGFNNNGALAPVSSLDSTRESTHFKFWYSVASGDTNAVSPTDTDSNGTPDYIDTMMTVFEHVWSTEIDSFGYTAPPPAAKFGGVNKKYVVLFSKISSNTFGLTFPDSLYKDNPNSTVIEKNASGSHIVMHNNYSQFPQHTQLEDIQVTAAHEFFHAIQDGYDVFSKSWLKESNATWMEDEVYDNINDNYSYLTNWFAQPWYALDATNAEINNHWYGSWIFFRYISEHISGRNTIKQIWEKTLNYNNDSTDYSFNAINDALILHGTTVNDVFREFLVANYIKTISPYNYEEGANYPNINIEKKMFGSMNYNTYIYRHGSSYIRISPNLLPVGNDQITFALTPIDTIANFEAEVVTKKGNIVTTNVFTSNFTLNNTKDFDDIVVIIMDLSTFAKVDSQKLHYKLNIQSNSKMYNIVKGHKVRVRNFNNNGVSGIEILTDNYNTNSQAYVNYFRTNFSLKTFTLNSSSNNVNIFLTNKFIPVMEWIGTGLNNTRYSYYYKNGSTIKINLPNNNANDLHLIGADYKSAWFGGDSLWRYNMDDNSIRNLGFVGYDGNWSYYSKKLIAVGSSTAWLTQTGDIVLEGILSSTKIIDNNFNRDGNWDYNGNVLVWTDKDSSGNYRIKAYSANTGHYFTIDSSGSRTRVVVTGGDWSDNDVKIAFSDNTQYPPKYYYTKGLPVTSKKELSVPGDGYLLINSSGVGLEIMKTNQTPQFYFHSFSSNNDYTTYLPDYTTADPVISNGDYIRMIDSTFYFDAINLTNTDNTVYIYSLKLGDAVTGISSDKINIPKIFRLNQNYPNPFNPTTTITYQLPINSKVTLNIYDILGRQIKTLVNKLQQAGNYKVNFDASKLSSGVYFYRLTMNNGFTQTKKMLLLK